MRVARRAPGWRARSKTGASSLEAVEDVGVVIPEARPDEQMIRNQEDIAGVFWATIDAAVARNPAMH